MALREQLDEELADNDEEPSDNDEKAYQRGWDQVFSAFDGVHPSVVAEVFGHKDLICMGQKNY